MISKCVKWNCTEYVFELHFTYQDSISVVDVYLLFEESSCLQNDLLEYDNLVGIGMFDVFTVVLLLLKQILFFKYFWASLPLLSKLLILTRYLRTCCRFE